MVDILYRTVEHSWSWLAGIYIQAENWSTRSSWRIVLRGNCLTLPPRIDLRTQVSNRELCNSGSFATFSGRPDASQGKFNYAMSRRVLWTNVKREVGHFSLVGEHVALAGNEWNFPLTIVLRGISEISNWELSHIAHRELEENSLCMCVCVCEREREIGRTTWRM